MSHHATTIHQHYAQLNECDGSKLQLLLHGNVSLQFRADQSGQANRQFSKSTPCLITLPNNPQRLFPTRLSITSSIIITDTLGRNYQGGQLTTTSASPDHVRFSCAFRHYDIGYNHNELLLSPK